MGAALCCGPPASAITAIKAKPSPATFISVSDSSSSQIASPAVSVKLRRKIGALVLIDPLRRLFEKL